VDIKERFGLKLKKLRQQKGLSQEAFANLSGIDRTYIPEIEKGKRNLSITIVEKLAKALEVNPGVFFEE